MNRKILLIICLMAITAVSFAQNNNSAEEDFDTYERGIGQSNNFEKNGNSGNANPCRRRKNCGGNNGNTSGGRNNSNPTQPVTPNTPKSIGRAGMRIWLEKQSNCRGQFILVLPTTTFRSADCIRMRYRLNFEGYLTIINIGTTGTNKVIFPTGNQSNRLLPKIDYYLPDAEGWEFDENPGKEQIVFIVSRNPIEQQFVDNYVNNREVVVTNSNDMEILDRDLRPRTERNKVYVLSDETRLEKPIVFRMAIKHVK